VARGWREGPATVVSLPAVALFRFHPDRDVVVAERFEGADAAEVEHAFYATALPLAAQAAGEIEAIHASAVLRATDVVAFCGRSGSGKSTLADAFARAACEPWADDALAFNTNGEVRAVRLPGTGRLDSAPSVPSASLAGIYVLAPGRHPLDPRCERLPASEALAVLLENAYRFFPQTARRGREVVSAYLELIAAVPVHRLTYAHDPRALPRVLSLVVEVLESRR
jgi:hypothetical protein